MRNEGRPPLVHPCHHAMIIAGGMDMGEYVERTSACLSFKTRYDLGATDTRLLEMPLLPPHNGGYTHQNEVMVNVRPTTGVNFLSRSPIEPGCVMVDRRMLPDTVFTGATGRALRDMLGHPMFEVPGLVIEEVEDCGPPYPDQVRVRLSKVSWLRAE